MGIIWDYFGLTRIELSFPTEEGWEPAMCLGMRRKHPNCDLSFAKSICLSSLLVSADLGATFDSVGHP